MFACLAVFAGGCTLEAAEEVCEADTRHARVARRQEPRAPARGRPLLDARDDPRARRRAARRARATPRSVRARHARYFTELAAHARPLDGVDRGGHAQRYDLAVPELDNFRAALDWAERRRPRARPRARGRAGEPLGHAAARGRDARLRRSSSARRGAALPPRGGRAQYRQLAPIVAGETPRWPRAATPRVSSSTSARGDEWGDRPCSSTGSA